MSPAGRSKAPLHVVEERPRTEIEQLLDAIVPTMITAEKAAERLKAIAAKAGRQLAQERGVAFIRDEQLRSEFGEC